ncbi:MAG: efflux RND transporter periplasmic adaptor subunit [bacterium]
MDPSAENHSSLSNHRLISTGRTIFSFMKKNKKTTLTGSLFLILLLIGLTFRTHDAEAFATFEVKQGEFTVSITIAGEIRATNSTNISIPRGGRIGQAQIVYLIPEGTTVKPGELLARLSTTEIDKFISDKEQEITVMNSDLDKLRADQMVRMGDYESSLKNADLSYEQAKLQIEKIKFEAEVARKEAEINLERNRLAYEQAKRKIEGQKVAEKSDENKSLLRIKLAENDLDRLKKERDQLTIPAPMPGLVIYETNWNTGRKIAVGNQVNPGQTLISLPDLSKMQVTSTVNEVDVSKVQKGQSVRVHLDAFPEKEFSAVVASVASIGQRDYNTNLKSFEVIIDLLQSSPILRPGMTSSNEIIMETLAGAIYIPLESVFEKEGKTIVYKMNGSNPIPQTVQVGVKSSNYIVVIEGLKAGELVALRDPFVKQSEPEQPAKTKGASL